MSVMSTNVIALEDVPQWRLRKKDRAYSLYARGALIDDKDEDLRPEAFRLYREAVLLDPELAVAWTNLGNCYYHDDEYERAIEAYQRAVILEPRQFEANLNLGIVYMDMAVGDNEPGFMKHAAMHLVVANGIDPMAPDPVFRLGDFHRIAGNKPAAKYWYALFLTLEKDTPLAVYAAQKLEELGNPPLEPFTP